MRWPHHMSKKSVAVDQERQEAALRVLIGLTSNGKKLFHCSHLFAGDQTQVLLVKGVVQRLEALLGSDDEIICSLACEAINNMCLHGRLGNCFCLQAGNKLAIPAFTEVASSVISRLLLILDFATNKVILNVLTTFTHFSAAGTFCVTTRD